MIRAGLICLLTVLANPAGLCFGEAAESPEALFARANGDYEKGRLGDARAGFEDLFAAGHNRAAVCYNLGNVHYRLRDRGRSVLWYERARCLDPRDEDVRHNLAFARAGLENEAGEVWELLDRVLTPVELPWAAAVAFWVLCLTAGTALFRGLPWPRVRVIILAALPAFIVLSAWLAARTRDLKAPWAIVVEKEVEVRSGPGEQFAVGFTVPEGRRTLILNRRPGWTEIGVPSQSLKGWVHAESVERIAEGGWPAPHLSGIL